MPPITVNPHEAAALAARQAQALATATARRTAGGKPVATPLDAFAQEAIDTDAAFLETLRQEHPDAKLPASVTTRAALRAHVAALPDRTAAQTLKEAAAQTGREWQGKDTATFVWPIAAAAIGAAWGLEASSAALGTIFGAAIAAGASIGKICGDYVNYLLFWSRSTKSYGEYRQNIADYKHRDKLNYEDRRLKVDGKDGDDKEFTSLFASGIGFLVGAAAGPFLVNAAAHAGGAEGFAFLPALAVLGGALAVRYGGLLATTPLRHFRHWAKLRAENKETRAVKALLAAAEKETGETYYAEDLGSALKLLQSVADGRLESGLAEVRGEIAALEGKIRDTEAFYAKIDRTRLSPEARAEFEAEKETDLAAYRSQKESLENQVLSELNAAKASARHHIRRLKIELGQSVELAGAEITDADYYLLVKQQIEVRKLSRERSQAQVEEHVARARALVGAVQNILAQIAIAERTHRELRESGIAP